MRNPSSRSKYERQRPPAAGPASNTVIVRPASAKATAADRPARPAPTTCTWDGIGAILGGIGDNLFIVAERVSILAACRFSWAPEYLQRGTGVPARASRAIANSLPAAAACWNHLAASCGSRGTP